MRSDEPAFGVVGLPLLETHSFDVDLETASGSRYKVTWDAEAGRGTLTRTPSSSGGKHPWSQPLRRDGETLSLLSFDRIDLGHPTAFVIDLRGDGVSTVRWANPAVAIYGTAWETADISSPTPNVLTTVQVEVMAARFDLASGDLVAVSNGMLGHVHSSSSCQGQPWGCWIHDPRPHPLDKAPVRWRDDKSTAERICDHGVGHPDPQDAAFWWNTQGRDVTIHGCDGCCGPCPDWATGLLPGHRP